MTMADTLNHTNWFSKNKQGLKHPKKDIQISNEDIKTYKKFIVCCKPNKTTNLEKTQ